MMSTLWSPIESNHKDRFRKIQKEKQRMLNTFFLTIGHGKKISPKKILPIKIHLKTPLKSSKKKIKTV